MVKKTAFYKIVYCQLLCFISIFIFPFLSEAAVRELLVTSSTDQYQLGYHIQTLEDKTGELSITDVSSSRFDDQFMDNNAAGINKGITDSFLWIRFSLAADHNHKVTMVAGDTAGRTEWLIFMGRHLDEFDEIKVFWQEGKDWHTKTYGLLQALERKTRDPLCIRVILPEKRLQPVTYYIRIATNSGFFLKPVLYSVAGYDRFSKKLSLFYGGYYGLALALVISNLYLLFFLGDRIRLLFVLNIISMCCYFIVVNECCYPIMSPVLLSASRRIAQFLCLFFIIQFTYFAMLFLNIKSLIPSFYRLLQFTMLSVFCLLLSMPFVSFTSLGKIVGIYAPVVFIQIMLAGIAAWYNGYKPARFFVFAWFFLLGGGIIKSFTFIGIFPFPFIGDHAVQIGSGVEMVLLSIALTDRVRFDMEKLDLERIKAEEKQIVYHEQLRNLSSQIVLTEERERRRIAVDLHDRIGHALSSIMMKLGALRQLKGLPDSHGLPHGSTVKLVNELSELVEQSIDDTQSLTFEISPPILYDLGLEAALDWLAEQTQKKYDIMVEFKSDDTPKYLDESIRVLLFQASRELLFNMVKHSQAEKGLVSVLRNGQHLKIVIEDNGVGFDPSNPKTYVNKNGGFGLFSIKERLSQQGGDLTIESKPGKGTRIIVVSPMKIN